VAAAAGPPTRTPSRRGAARADVLIRIPTESTEEPTMKAIVQDRYGPPSVLRLDEVPAPEPGAGEVLVAVHAATVNARDWHAMRGDPYLARASFGVRRPRPRIRGTDFAGRVAALGPGATRFRIGDEVYGEAEGAFAEYVRAPEGVIGCKPANLTFAQAAAVPLAANTALVCLRDGRTRPGAHVLVNGASGGVGTFAVQIAKVLGATVTAVCSPRNVELVRSLGADAVVDYTVEDFTRSGERYDVVLDLVGNHPLRALRRAVDPGGAVVLSGGGTSEGLTLVGPMGLAIRGMVAARLRPGRVAVTGAEPSTQNLDELRELIESGRVTPVIDRTYPLAETAAAIRYVEDEHARAKVVISIDGTDGADADGR
jgi:NADPH:quinone reductase-like Zn-dependent oxidoreductase